MVVLSKNQFCLILTLCFLRTILIDSRAVDKRCQVNRIPWCLGVYDAVIFPNFLGHQTQEDAYYAMHKLWPLIQTRCSSQVLHYMCRLYAPQCPYFAADRDASYVSYHPQQYRPPCEDACLTVRHDCHEILWKHNIPWPSELECHRLRNADCIETPQIEVKPTDRPLAPSEPLAPAEPETTTQVTEPAAPTEEVPEETATITAGGDGLVEITEATSGDDVEAVTEEESTPEPVTEEVTEPDAEEPESITGDATTGSLLGISPVIQEDPVTPDRGETDGSGEDDEPTAVGAAEEPTTHAPIETPSAEVAAAPHATGEVITAADNSSLANGEDAPRSDRAVSSNASYLRNRFESNVGQMIIYLVTLSLIFHRGA